jgi:hypothetical protein
MPERPWSGTVTTQHASVPEASSAEPGTRVVVLGLGSRARIVADEMDASDRGV